ncbi:MAG: 3'-5' exonuclease [Thermodesulfovibrionales bacterium]
MIDFLNIKKSRAMKQGQDVDIRDAAYVVIDTELTGLNENKDSIVSIGAVKMSGGGIELGQTFYNLINPETALTAQSVVIHEIMPSDVSEKPPVSFVLSAFLEFCNTDIMVGFCVSIDMSFLAREAKRFLGTAIRNQVLDILPLYEWIHNRENSRRQQRMDLPLQYSLYDIAKFYGIDISSSHNALVDAYITAQIFQRFIPYFIEAGITSVGDLMKLSGRLKGGERPAVSRGFSNF